MTSNTFNFNGLDSAVHGPVRLGVLTALQIDGPLDFTTLKKRLEVSDGALGIHLTKLDDIGYLMCQKKFVGKRPKSTYSITKKGKQALENYLDTMQTVIDAMKKAV